MQSEVTVLVVEDEPLVRLNAVEIIEEAGWAAIEVANSTDALAVLDSGTPIDVLFTDINMPGQMDGLQLASCVHALRPRVHLVVTSGKRHLSDCVLPDNGTFLPKPYGVEQLTHVIGCKLNERH